ncbi:hypothetical protein MARPO_0086s0030 [Marchantia polymorpha]|uniref:Uncharacterized protein n=1 Tax=Marchantia polymorpha TaxID=3197 RepID=A0A2R6WIP1_MARPO|nr:hypothetical protein MARPO_0086s0030 [Marchantia polymorpha]|eukprot:PTQ33703.1 hypothetical protein MARPO_0086s0030 [Marchantia polymorpha]
MNACFRRRRKIGVTHNSSIPTHQPMDSFPGQGGGVMTAFFIYSRLRKSLTRRTDPRTVEAPDGGRVKAANAFFRGGLKTTVFGRSFETCVLRGCVEGNRILGGSIETTVFRQGPATPPAYSKTIGNRESEGKCAPRHAVVFLRLALFRHCLTLGAPIHGRLIALQHALGQSLQADIAPPSASEEPLEPGQNPRLLALLNLLGNDGFAGPRGANFLRFQIDRHPLLLPFNLSLLAFPLRSPIVERRGVALLEPGHERCLGRQTPEVQPRGRAAVLLRDEFGRGQAARGPEQLVGGSAGVRTQLGNAVGEHAPMARATGGHLAALTAAGIRSGRDHHLQVGGVDYVLVGAHGVGASAQNRPAAAVIVGPPLHPAQLDGEHGSDGGAALRPVEHGLDFRAVEPQPVVVVLAQVAAGAPAVLRQQRRGRDPPAQVRRPQAVAHAAPAAEATGIREGPGAGADVVRKERAPA